MRARASRARALALLGAIVIIGVTMLLRGRGPSGAYAAAAASASVSAASASASSSAAPPPAPKAEPKAPGVATKVTVGMYLRQVPEVDLRTNSFWADFYLWFLWAGDDLDPTTTFEFANLRAATELHKAPVYMDDAGKEAPQVLPDGRKYQVYRVQGRFGQQFVLSAFPLDEQSLEIHVEDARHNDKELVYVADAASSKAADDVSIPGWKVGKSRMEVGSVTFDTAFGDPREAGKEVYSRASFVLPLHRPAASLLAKTVLPIVLVIVITFGAFFCAPNEIDARLTLTITALISAVALQYTTSNELPPTSYLMLLDRVYILSYIVILLGTFSSIYSNRLAGADEMEKAHRVDRIALISLAVAFFGGTAIFLLVR